MKYPKLCPLTAAIVISGFSSFANAQLGQNLAVDIRSLSMGNAVTADPPGISAVHFNPAALAKIDGLQTDVQGFLQTLIFKENSQHRLDITFLVIQMTRLFVMMVQKFQPIFVQILKTLFTVMWSTRACMYLFLKNGRSRSRLSTSCPYSRNCL